MNRTHFDTDDYALQIRKLAARHQSGEAITEIKISVDSIILSLEERFYYDPFLMYEIWCELFTKLNCCISKIAAPEWVAVIFYARKLISRRKGNIKIKIKNIIKINNKV